MRLRTGSSTGPVITVAPFSIDMSLLTEGTDFDNQYIGQPDSDADGFIEYTQGQNTIKTVSLVFGTDNVNVIDACSGIDNATPLTPEFSWVDVGGTYAVSETVTEITAGTPEPDDFALHWRDWYYKTKDPVIVGGDTVGHVIRDRYANSTWIDTINSYYNNTLCNIYWVPSGGSFGAGINYQQSGNNIAVNYFGCYEALYSGAVRSRLAPKLIGVSDASSNLMIPDFFATSYPLYNPCFQTVSKPASAAFTDDKHKVCLCSFTYKDVQMVGVAVVELAPDNTLSKLGLWAASIEYWNDRESRYNYTINPDGSVHKAVNPNYTLSTARRSQQGLPGTNTLVTGTNYISTAYGVPYGYATYKLSDSDFKTCIADWSNTLARWLQDNGFTQRLFHPVQSTVSGVQSLLSSPIESILQVHALPVPESFISTALSPPISYVRSGGADSTVSTASRFVADGYRVIELTSVSSFVGAYTNGFADYSNTTCSIYIPCFGEYPLRTEQVINNSIGLRYRVDIMTGDTVVTVSNNDEGTILTLSGNIAIPVTCSSSPSIQERALRSVSSAVSSAVQIVGAGAANNAGAMVSAASSAVSSLTNNMERHASYAQIGGNGGLFSGLYEPYIIIKRPNPVSGNFSDQTSVLGYETGVRGQIQSMADPDGLPAFVKVLEADLRGITNTVGPATSEELAEIESRLKGGIIL